MYTTTVLEYLQVKYGKLAPTTMTTDDARILGIAYPMRPKWLAEHGPRKIDMRTMTELLDALAIRVKKSMRRVEAGLPLRSFDVCLEHKRNLEEHYGEPVLTEPAPVVEVQQEPTSKKLTKKQRRQEAAKLRKTNTQIAAEIKAHRAKKERPAPVRRVPVGCLTVEGVDVSSKDFLSTYAWRNLRIKALNLYGRKCMCCGDTPENGAVMNVDHIKPRIRYPHLALDIRWLQILCGACNHGKGNELETDYRSPAQIAAANAAALVI